MNELRANKGGFFIHRRKRLFLSFFFHMGNIKTGSNKKNVVARFCGGRGAVYLTGNCCMGNFFFFPPHKRMKIQ